MTSNNTMAMFPGQGSQYAGMAKILLEEFPYTKLLFEEADDIARAPIKKLCLEGPDDQLKLTANTQPCIVATSIATWQVMKQEKGFSAKIYAGHSLGEYSALVAAGRVPFATAIKLVRARGLAMQKAVPEGHGSMSAVLSCTAEKLEELCKASSKSDESVEVVNYNSPQQLVVAGATAAVRRLEEQLTLIGVKFVTLQVSAPFHSSMMAPARIEMAPILLETTLENNETQIIPNLTADITTHYTVDYLINQIDSPVRWTQSMQSACAHGMQSFVEVGPGKVLWGLARKILPKGEFKLSQTDNIKDWLNSGL